MSEFKNKIMCCRKCCRFFIFYVALFVCFEFVLEICSSQSLCHHYIRLQNARKVLIKASVKKLGNSLLEFDVSRGLNTIFNVQCLTIFNTYDVAEDRQPSKKAFTRFTSNVISSVHGESKSKSQPTWKPIHMGQ